MLPAEETVETKWGDISLVEAQNRLFFRAMREDFDVYKMVLVSQSCIPLKTFQQVHRALTADGRSYVNEEPGHMALPRCLGAARFMPVSEIFKSSQWIVLGRDAAATCLAHPEYVEYFRRVFAPEEHFYITVLRKFRPKDPLIVYQPDLREATTFTYWHGMTDAYPFAAGKDPGTRSIGPHLFEQVTAEELAYLRGSSPCLLGRKFAAQCVVVEAGGLRRPLAEYF